MLDARAGERPAELVEPRSWGMVLTRAHLRGLPAACLLALLCACGGGRDGAPNLAGAESFVDAKLELPPDLKFDATASGPIEGEVSTSAAMLGTGRQATVVFSRPDDGATDAPGGPTQNVGPDGLVACDVPSDGYRYRVVSRVVPASELCALAPPAEADTVALVEHSPVPGTGAVPAPLSQPFELRSFTSRDPDTEVQRSAAVGEFAGDAGTIELLSWWYGAHRREGDVYVFEMDAYAQISDGAVEDVDVPKAHLYVYEETGTVKLVRLAALSTSEERTVIDSVDWSS